MNLKIETVTKNSKDFDKLNNIFMEAFPKEERDNENFYELYDDINEFSKFYSFYDESNIDPVGFVVGIDIGDVFYILYLAINKNIRSCGYGSKIINLIKDVSKEKTVVACIENTKDEKAQNIDQRIKRKEFYLRNGLMLSEEIVSWNGIDFEVVVSKQYDKLKELLEYVLKELNNNLT